ncbi:hypothetical protein M0R45_013111 [Rubus argutus]|uniref:Anaphase-promoting complex subunit 4-like WD40 domain-containing protein n=1 Tax=Rubus argutus TaxID=59490 RepID=A0AAW1XIB0_RUBAR
MRRRRVSSSASRKFRAESCCCRRSKVLDLEEEEEEEEGVENEVVVMVKWGLDLYGQVKLAQDAGLQDPYSWQNWLKEPVQFKARFSNGNRRRTTGPFQLQFDKPVASQIKIAEWNPEKDLLAMVTEDSKILLHRFNWQRLWTISPGRSITSLCWRPDGKAIAVGLEDGTVSLHDVENGKLLRSLKSHTVAVVSLNWEEDGQMTRGCCHLSNCRPYINLIMMDEIMNSL